MKRKILLMENDIWSLCNFRLGIIKKMIELGYEVHLSGIDNENEKINNLKIYKHNLNIKSSSKNIIDDLRLSFEIFRLYWEIKPDYTLLYSIKPNIYGNFVAKILNIKTISNVNGLGNVFMSANKTRKIVELLYKLAFKHPTKIFFQNRDDMNLFLNSKLVEKEEVERIPGSGVNLKKFKPVKKQRNLEKIVFLLISRMIWTKGIKEYIEAAKILKIKGYKDVEFQLLGPLNVDNEEAIEKEYLDNNKRYIKYLGVSKDVREEIRNSDCIVLPSFYREGVPKTLIEAASMGKPIITTDNVGCRDIVENNYNGFLVKIKNVEDLALKLEKFIKLSKKEKIRLGKNSRNKAEKEFDEEIIINKYKNLINK
ncbi:MAG: glycosyltransferase family 4 protein [Fusobacterium sp. JB019]|nr:glycosyltransferase family 4 protein [Fusobacterium sp. JB019]